MRTSLRLLLLAPLSKPNWMHSNFRSLLSSGETSSPHMKLLSDVTRTPTQISQIFPHAWQTATQWAFVQRPWSRVKSTHDNWFTGSKWETTTNSVGRGIVVAVRKKKCSPGLAPTDSDKFQQSAGVTICLILVVALSGVGPHHSPIIWQQNICGSSEQVQLATIHRVHTQTPMGEGVLKWLCSLPLKGQPIKMQPQPSYLPLQTAECSVEKQNKASCQ